jgi:hypothetical protein
MRRWRHLLALLDVGMWCMQPDSQEPILYTPYPKDGKTWLASVGIVKASSVMPVCSSNTLSLTPKPA